MIRAKLEYMNLYKETGVKFNILPWASHNPEPLLSIGDEILLVYRDEEWELIERPPELWTYDIGITEAAKLWGVSPTEAAKTASSFVDRGLPESRWKASYMGRIVSARGKDWRRCNRGVVVSDSTYTDGAVGVYEMGSWTEPNDHAWGDAFVSDPWPSSR